MPTRVGRCLTKKNRYGNTGLQPNAACLPGGEYNHHGDEELTPALFEETFGKVDGSHYYEKWTGYFNRNLWDMIAYFRSEKENGQKFCDMVARQVGLYQQNRS